MLLLFALVFALVSSQTAIAPYQSYYDVNDCSTSSGPTMFHDYSAPFAPVCNFMPPGPPLAGFQLQCNGGDKEIESFLDPCSTSVGITDSSPLDACSSAGGSIYYDETCTEPTYNAPFYASAMSYDQSDCVFGMFYGESSHPLYAVPSQCFRHGSNYGKVQCHHGQSSIFQYTSYSDSQCMTEIGTQDHTASSCLPLENGGADNYLEVLSCPANFGMYQYRTVYNTDATCSTDSDVVVLYDYADFFFTCLDVGGSFGIEYGPITTSEMVFAVYPDSTTCASGDDWTIEELYVESCALDGTMYLREHGESAPSITPALFATFEMWDGQASCTSGPAIGQRRIDGSMRPFVCVPSPFAVDTWIMLSCEDDGSSGTIRDYDTPDCSGTPLLVSNPVPADGATCVRLHDTATYYIIGYTCPYPQCEDGENFNTVDACGGHGDCTALDTACVCEDNWENHVGLCDDYKCADDIWALSTNSTPAAPACGGNGACTPEDETCVCTAGTGWSGVGCTECAANWNAECTACLDGYVASGNACNKGTLLQILIPAIAAPVAVILFLAVVGGLILVICCFLKRKAPAGAPAAQTVKVELDEPTADVGKQKSDSSSDDKKSDSSSSDS